MSSRELSVAHRKISINLLVNTEDLLVYSSKKLYLDFTSIITRFSTAKLIFPRILQKNLEAKEAEIFEDLLLLANRRFSAST